MNVTFTSYGAAECVAGSRHLLTVNDYKLLVDIGYEHSHLPEPLGFDSASLDALVLTHGHADHVGRLYELVYQGFCGPIYTHPATKDICRVQLEEELIISMFRKGKRVKQHQIDRAKQEIEKIVDRITPIPYGQKQVLTQSLTRTTLDAGHLIGSEQELFTVDNITIGCGGDLGRTDAEIPFTRKPEQLPKNLDFYVLEGTYGTKVHTRTRSFSDELIDWIQLAHSRGGKLVFPTFSIQRAQHMLIYLFHLYEQKKIPKIDIVFDSPSAEKVNKIVLKHINCLDVLTQKLFTNATHNPFRFSALKYTRNTQESIALGSRKTPAVIITSSGMCNGGRVENYLAKIIQDKRNVLVLTGYQAQGTKGSYLANGAHEIRVKGKKVYVNATIGKVHGFSGHSDCQESIKHLKSSNDPNKGEDFAGIFLVHGEKQNLCDLKQMLNSVGFRNVVVAEKGKTYNLYEMYQKFHKLI